MLRHISLHWSPENGQQCAEVQMLQRRLSESKTPWQRVLSRDGAVIHAAHVPHHSPVHAVPGGGVILGALFERRCDPADDTPSAPVILDEPRAHALLASGGRWLIERCWGNYLAYLFADRSPRCLLVKDPCGNLPCHITAHAGITVCFSHVADCRALGIARFTINPKYLHAQVVGGFGALEQETFLEASRLQRGERVEIDPSRAVGARRRTLLWTPVTFTAADRALDDPGTAAIAMRGTIRGCARTWAGLHTSSLLRLSGGLDSSIVLGCLHGTAGLAAYTYFNPGGRSDERPWARMAAAAARCEHFECPVQPAQTNLAPALSMPPSMEPLSVVGYLQRCEIELPLAARRGATAVYTGDGGDSGFCSDTVGYAVPEYLRRYGPNRAALRLAARVALSTDRSIATVLMRALRGVVAPHGLGRNDPTLALAAQMASIAARASFAAENRFVHPWFREHGDVSWPTLRRMGALAGAPDPLETAGDPEHAPQIVAPLYSQPVIELLLAIPIHVHYEDGLDRGLARRAFAADVPQPILQRLWKDRAPGFYDALVARNLPLLRAALLDGVLMEQGWLDRRVVEQALSDTQSKSTVYPTEIMRHLHTELWARHWTARRGQIERGDRAPTAGACIA